MAAVEAMAMEGGVAMVAGVSVDYCFLPLRWRQVKDCDEQGFFIALNLQA